MSWVWRRRTEVLSFDFLIPTKVLFGEGKIEQLGDEIKKYGKRILWAYGQGSIKRRGLYRKITAILNEQKIFYKELPGIKPNPRISSVRDGIKICRENKLEFVLAVGGGSVMDCSKAIAAGVYYQGDPWDFLLRKASVRKALPLGTIVTLAATGSEMNGGAVISNEDTEEKLVMFCDLLVPKFSILDPVQTFTVPKEHTAAGVVDIFSHVLEQYFSSAQGAFLPDRMAEAFLKTCIYYGSVVLREPENYEARANLMWASSLGLNGLLSSGKTSGDWATHMMEHEISAIYDITHGVGLALLTPSWMRYVLDDSNMAKFAEYGRNVWSITGDDAFEVAKKSIGKTEKFFKTIGMPFKLREIGIDEKRIDEMAGKATRWGKLGDLKRLNKKDVVNILQKAF